MLRFEQVSGTAANSWQDRERIMRQGNKEVQLETMLTARQVANFLQVSISTVRRWSDSGMLKCYRVGSRGDRRFRRQDVLRFMREPGSRSQTGGAENQTNRSDTATQSSKRKRRS